MRARRARRPSEEVSGRNYRSRILLLLRHAEIFQLRGDRRAVRIRLHLLVDKEDLAVLADVECPPGGELSLLVEHAICLRYVATRIAQDGVVRLDRLGEFLVRFGRVATGGEVSNLELADVTAALPERLALRSSTTRKGLGKPREHDRLFAFEARKLVCLPIAPGQRKVGGRVPDLQGFACLRGPGANQREHQRGAKARSENCVHVSMPDYDCTALFEIGASEGI